MQRLLLWLCDRLLHIDFLDADRERREAKCGHHIIGSSKTYTSLWTGTCPYTQPDTFEGTKGRLTDFRAVTKHILHGNSVGGCLFDCPDRRAG